MLGVRLSEVSMKVVRGLDAMYDAGGHEEGEGQHKADLVDQLCLTFCHLVMMADASDLQEIDAALQASYLYRSTILLVLHLILKDIWPLVLDTAQTFT